MSIHSKFIVHWTGHDFHKPKSPITDGLRHQYVERLRNDCLKGLFMRPGEEEIYGSDDTSLKASISRVCFTEIRLSQVENHAKFYGSLGIGFHRSFILEREGNPALYVQNGDKGVLIEQLAKLAYYLKDLPDRTMYERLSVVSGYLKNMSHHNNPDLEFYEQMEWRIVHLNRLMGKYIEVEDASQYFYRLKLKSDDIKIIVFPDHETKQDAVANHDIAKFFSDGFPMMTTVADCESF